MIHRWGRSGCTFASKRPCRSASPAGRRRTVRRASRWWRREDSSPTRSQLPRWSSNLISFNHTQETINSTYTVWLPNLKKKDATIRSKRTVDKQQIPKMKINTISLFSCSIFFYRLTWDNGDGFERSQDSERPQCRQIAQIDSHRHVPIPCFVFVFCFFWVCGGRSETLRSTRTDTDTHAGR